jgi:catalase (peroxidase I)
MVRSIAIFASLAPLAASQQKHDIASDWAEMYEQGTPFADSNPAPTDEMYANALRGLDVNSLTDDIKNLLAGDSNPEWPADFGYYGPLFVRLAWHCSGSYRVTDGKGGCTGGRQRFEPERSWDDNANLDKARALLTPIKDKYGGALSWGDLIIAAGTTALRVMGTPIEQFCFGRIDDSDGTNSLALGPSDEQRQVAPCEVNGQCERPLGSTTIGLIYLNPEGPVVEAGGSPVPDPSLSAKDVRDSFSRMDHDDRATVALIGGGHAFGKTHGACPKGPGLRPSEAFAQGHPTAWQGECGDGDMKGKGNNTFTSGFEGPWTTQPTKWDNEFFNKLLDREWEKFMGPGGHWQWRIKNATEAESGLMRLTSDIALIHDDAYLQIVKEFASDMNAFDEAFDKAWFKLTHSGGRWSPEAKCDAGAVPSWVVEQEYAKMLDTDIVLV